MSNDELIRRGDALVAVMPDGFCHGQPTTMGASRAAITAIPAVTAPQGAWPEAASRMKAALDAAPDYKMFGISADDLRSILAALAAAQPAPTMTDLMVAPESIDAFMKANPLPPDAPHEWDGELVISICHATDCRPSEARAALDALKRGGA